MRKEIYLIKGTAGESYPAFAERIATLAKKLSDDPLIKSLKYLVTIDSTPKISVIPFKKEKIAAINIISEDTVNTRILQDEPGFEGAYLVDEALPVAYEKTWADGNITPGICLLTLFNRKPGIDYNTFLNRWHNSHTPLSLEIHPLWHYDRNVVVEKLTANSKTWEGIVAEHFRSRSDLLNPFVFFGPPLKMVYNMIRVYSDTKSFLDYKTIETYLVNEVHVKS